MTVQSLFSEYWGVVATTAGFVAAFAASHWRLDTKHQVQSKAVDHRLNTTDKALSEIKADLKEVVKKVEASKDHATNLHLQLLSELRRSPSDNSRTGGGD